MANLPLAAMAEAGGAALGKLLDKVADPAFWAAMSPSAGLTVTPAVFQSVEQEGRWKPKRWFNEGRGLWPKGRPDDAGAGAGASDESVGAKTAEQELHFGELKTYQMTLFTVVVGDGTSTFSVDATWWADGLEILAGYAGLSTATGFGSQYNHNASATLYAIPFGNYYPAKAFLAWSGWVNPVASVFYEFRGAMVVGAEGAYADPNLTPSPKAPRTLLEIDRHPEPSADVAKLMRLPAYMRKWNRREDGKQQVVPWRQGKGFVLEVE